MSHSPRAPRLSRRSFLKSAAALSAGVVAPVTLSRAAAAAAARGAASGRELKTDVLIIGGSLGGVAAALAAARMGRTVLLTEETAWIGGQATTQAIPLDEHPWSERYGRTQSYADFRDGVRAYYRRHYPLTAAARGDRHLNPGAGWVSKLCFEPRVGLAVLNEMLAPHLSAGRIRILTHHRPIAVAMDRDHARAVTVLDERNNVQRTFSAPYILDATELGDLLELGRIESVIGAESRAETGEPLAVDGPAEPHEQMVFTHVFALDYFPGEEHVIEKPRDYDFWLKAESHRGDFPKFTLPDLFGAKYDHFQRELVRQGVELEWLRMDTSRSYYSHHNLELKDADTFYFGEAWRLPGAASSG